MQENQKHLKLRKVKHVRTYPMIFFILTMLLIIKFAMDIFYLIPKEVI